MMGIVVPETCWAYKKYNKIIVTSSLFLFSSYHNEARSNKYQIHITWKFRELGLCYRNMRRFFFQHADLFVF
jgi:hypothetical protein